MSTNTTARGPPLGMGPSAAPISLQGRKRPVETVIKAVLATAAFISVAITIGIIIALLEPVLHFFGQVSFGEFFATEGKYAVLPLVAGTMMTTLISLLVAVPLGLGAAMYLSEYASRRNRKLLKPILELLAGVPSVVYGFFALYFVTPTLLQDILSIGVGFTNALAAGLVLGIMIIPTVASLSEDAMSAVPQALRQGSFARGANRMQTTLRVVHPAALSGVGQRHLPAGQAAVPGRQGAGHRVGPAGSLADRPVQGDLRLVRGHLHRVGVRDPVRPCLERPGAGRGGKNAEQHTE